MIVGGASGELKAIASHSATITEYKLLSAGHNRHCIGFGRDNDGQEEGRQGTADDATAASDAVIGEPTVQAAARLGPINLFQKPFPFLIFTCPAVLPLSDWENKRLWRSTM